MAPRDITEDTILGNLAKHTGDDFTSDADSGGDDNFDTSDGGDDAVSSRGGSRRSNAQDNQDGDLPSRRSTKPDADQSTQPANRNGSKQPDGTVDPKGAKTDAKGNLVDQHGNLLATAGAERRVVERQRAYIQNIEREVVDLRKKLEDTSFLGGVPAKYGLDNDDVATGLQLVADFKRSPVEVARKVLERALAAGHNLNEILGEGASSIEMSGVKRLISEHLAPVKQRTDREAAIERASEEGEKQYLKFLNDYPEAAPHEDAIANLMRKGHSAERAVVMLQQFAYKNQLNFDEPLGPQLAARANGGQNRQGNGARDVNNNNTRGQPIPNGGSGGNDASYRSTAPASNDMSYDEIIRGAMAEAGIRY